MKTAVREKSVAAIEHPGEQASNQLRRRLARAEPRTQRTFTPSLAVLQKSAGWWHWTPEGRKLLDFTSGVLVSNLGHNPSAWWRRVLQHLGVDQANPDEAYHQAAPLTAYNALTELEVLASERLLANLQAQPGGRRMEQVLWAASGSEAIQKALWAAMARRPGREEIVATRRGFHGKKGLAGATTGTEDDPERDPRVHFVRFPIEECIDVQRRRQPIDLAPYQQELDQLARRRGERLCCLITEPYLGGGGSYHPQKEYLQLLEQFCRQHDLALILDEIQSCFGRTGPMYAFTRYGVEPDIVCLGKGMSNGVPAAAAVGRANLFAALDYGEGSDTWSANPLTAAAVLATLDLFETTDVLQRGRKLAQTLEQGLLQLLDTGVVAHVRGEGCVWGVQCAAVGSRSSRETANSCVEACYRGDEKGRAIHLLGPLAGDVIRVSPPLVTPAEVASEYLDVMFRLFADVARRLREENGQQTRQSDQPPGADRGTN